MDSIGLVYKHAVDAHVVWLLDRLQWKTRSPRTKRIVTAEVLRIGAWQIPIHV